MVKPILSIITVVYNDSNGLCKTINSIINQSIIIKIEYIIIDGGSSDNTINIIKKYSNYVDYWISESDEGIYHAMNKGVQVSTGESLLFLNAGDYFVGDVINELNFKYPALIPVKYKSRFGTLTRFKKRNYKFSPPYCHQGIVFENKKLFYDLKYSIMADYDYYLQHNYTTLKMIKADGYVLYDNNGISTSQYLLKYREVSQIIKKNFPLFNYYIYRVRSSFKHYIKTILNALNL